MFCLLRYVEAKKDRVTVVFSTVFKDDDDVIIGKVFMQVCEAACAYKSATFCEVIQGQSPLRNNCCIPTLYFLLGKKQQMWQNGKTVIVHLLVRCTGVQRGSTSQPHSPPGAVQPQGAPTGAEGHRRHRRGQHWIHHLWWEPVIAFTETLFVCVAPDQWSHNWFTGVYALFLCFQSCSHVTPMPMPETTPSTSSTPSGTTCTTT